MLMPTPMPSPTCSRGGANRPPPEMTTEINNPPCVRCKRLKITCFVKKARVGDTKKRPACFPCAGKKQRCDWEDESEPAPGLVKTKPTQKPTQKPTPTSSRPTRTTKKTKVKPEEPPRKRMKRKVPISDDEGAASWPAGVIRVGKPIPKMAASTPKADPNAASDAGSSIPRFSAMEKGKGRFRGESIYCKNSQVTNCLVDHDDDEDNFEGLKTCIGRLENQVQDVPSSADWEENHPKIIKEDLEEMKVDQEMIKGDIEKIKTKFEKLHRNHKRLRTKAAVAEEVYAQLEEAQLVAISYAKELEAERAKRVKVEESLWNIGIFLG